MINQLIVICCENRGVNRLRNKNVTCFWLIYLSYMAISSVSVGVCVCETSLSLLKLT